MGQGGDFVGPQAQRPAGQYRIDCAAVAGDGLGTQGRGQCTNQLEAGLFEQGQVVIHRFYQHQYLVCHALPPGHSQKRGIMPAWAYWAKARPRPPGTPLLSVSCQGPSGLVAQLQPLLKR